MLSRILFCLLQRSKAARGVRRDPRGRGPRPERVWACSGYRRAARGGIGWWGGCARTRTLGGEADARERAPRRRRPQALFDSAPARSTGSRASSPPSSKAGSLRFLPSSRAVETRTDSRAAQVVKRKRGGAVAGDEEARLASRLTTRMHSKKIRTYSFRLFFCSC